MITDFNALARKIITENQYLTLATVDKDNGTWVCILCYAFDRDFNFYFASLETSRHSQNISCSPIVSFSIFDSRQDWGIGVGLQIEGLVKTIDNSNLSNVSAIYFSRQFPYGNATGEFAEEFKKQLNKNTYKFYKIIPTRVWMNNPNSKTDERVGINLRRS